MISFGRNMHFLLCFNKTVLNNGMVKFITNVNKKSIDCIMRYRVYATDSRGSFLRKAKSRSIKEIILSPSGEGAFGLGKGFLAGSSLLGLGALCYYGLGLSKEVGSIDKVMFWPDYVKERIRSTYMYFGGSVMITGVTAISFFKSPTLLKLATKNSFLAIGLSLAALMGSGIVLQSMPYSEGFGNKQLAWMAHSSIMGFVLTPICVLGGSLLIRAALYSAGIITSLSTLAVCSPSEKFLSLGGPLAIGLGIVFASSLGSMFFPPSTALGAGLYSMSLYGGLILFSLFLLYDTQRIIKKAETHSFYSTVPFDPINTSLSIYLDTVNIFVRIATLLAGGGGNKRK